jgi:endonuclease I
VKKNYWFIFLLFSSLFSVGQPPTGYYNSVNGLYGESLRNALKEIIDDHGVVTYASLWIHFEQTDTKPNNTIWDIYSDNPGGTAPYTFTYSVNQCGNYSQEGDCYNREHIVPQNWFSTGSDMYTDLFNLYPTDGFVNGKRAEYPYGEVGSATWTSQNGSKLGSSNLSNYSGTVFEPIDEYKGDLARSYFYIATRYKNEITNWNGQMFSNDNLSEWAIDMLLNWAENDPVSQKEIDRNNAIYQIQTNRNPFIDKPEYIDRIWGSLASTQEKNKKKASVYYNNEKILLNIPISSFEQYQINIFDAMGKLVLQEVGSTTQHQIDFSNPKGIYFITILTENGDFYNLKF